MRKHWPDKAHLDNVIDRLKRRCPCGGIAWRGMRLGRVQGRPWQEPYVWWRLSCWGCPHVAAFTRICAMDRRPPQG